MQARTPYPRLPHSTSRHPHRLNPSIVSHGLCRSPLKRVWLFLCLLHPHKPPSPCARFTKPPPAPVTSSFAFYAHTYAYTGGINMCVCTRGYQTSHARAITNVGRSQLHRFIAVTADLRVAVIKTKKKKRKRGRTDRNNGSRLPKGWWLPSPKWKTRYIMGFSTGTTDTYAVSRMLPKILFPRGILWGFPFSYRTLVLCNFD